MADFDSSGNALIEAAGLRERVETHDKDIAGSAMLVSEDREGRAELHAFGREIRRISVDYKFKKQLDDLQRRSADTYSFRDALLDERKRVDDLERDIRDLMRSIPSPGK